MCIHWTIHPIMQRHLPQIINKQKKKQSLASTSLLIKKKISSSFLEANYLLQSLYHKIVFFFIILYYHYSKIPFSSVFLKWTIFIILEVSYASYFIRIINTYFQVFNYRVVLYNSSANGNKLQTNPDKHQLQT